MELSLKKMGALMANISKFVNQIPIERMLTVNSKYYSTPRANLWENLKSNGTPNELTDGHT